ncbi:ras-like protein family member 10B [Schistocerca serialis cubense]|uniref:ras-like protein family member 10B n=1 Tax=Schistocerca serialis cubense TaxID=2023355 RepID=UPI00214F50EF|nr:ras-like protein family member 10B [Schistocerca serialis cubense]
MARRGAGEESWRRRETPPPPPPPLAATAAASRRSGMRPTGGCRPCSHESTLDTVLSTKLQGTGDNAVSNLDLDYLERRSSADAGRHQASPDVEQSPDSVDLVKVVLLGASAVGKTSIVQQFVWGEFSEDYVSTERRHTYYPSVIINERLYRLKISDIPVIPYFPVNSFYEWSDTRFYGLRSASAYLLVFDLADAASFQFARTLLEQLSESRDMADVTILVVGNKSDLLPGSLDSPERVPGRDLARPDLWSEVRASWGCGYAECSARQRGQVLAVFQRLMRQVDRLLGAAGAASPPIPASYGLLAASSPEDGDADDERPERGFLETPDDRATCHLL